MNALPATAPRGKVFAITRMSHVAGFKGPQAVVEPGRWRERKDAEAAAARIDERLQPTVTLVPEVRP